MTMSGSNGCSGTGKTSLSQALTVLRFLTLSVAFLFQPLTTFGKLDISKHTRTPKVGTCGCGSKLNDRRGTPGFGTHVSTRSDRQPILENSPVSWNSPQPCMNEQGVSLIDPGNLRVLARLEGQESLSCGRLWWSFDRSGIPFWVDWVNSPPVLEPILVVESDVH